jgi:hypothetical protein
LLWLRLCLKLPATTCGLPRILLPADVRDLR